MQALRIGILVDSLRKQQYLEQLVEKAQQKIGCSLLLQPSSPAPRLDQPVDAWVLDVKATEGNAGPSALNAAVEALLAQTIIPVIVCDESLAAYGVSEHQQEWRKIVSRLQRLRGDITLQKATGATEVWVLAASTGGPAAVKEFMSALPPELNIAFVYVQHIDSQQSEALAKMMETAGHYPVSIAQDGSLIAPNTLTLVAAAQHISLLDNGTLVMSNLEWSGNYSPSINHIAANVARIYRQLSGMIVFTGMGDDGAASCKLIKQQGGHVWVQTPVSCTIAAMPEAALATGTVSTMGTPQELAHALVALKQPALGNI